MSIDFNKMPKVDLHLHLDGAIRTQTIIDLAKEQNFTLPAYDVAGLNEFVRVKPTCNSLTDFLATFNVFYPILEARNALPRIVSELCEDLKDDNVVYAEIRFAPILYIPDKDDDKLRQKQMEQNVSDITDAFAKAKEKSGIDGGLLLCGYRSESVIACHELVEIIQSVNDKYPGKTPIKGLDLAGDESKYPGHPFKDAFDKADKFNIPITVHAAEGAGPESAKEAIEILHAKRIGHGVKIINDKELYESVKASQIPLEVCLTSNVQTGTVENYNTHPFSQFFRDNFAVTLNTDDPAISNITLTNEWEVASKAYNFTEADIKKILDNSVQVSFAKDEVKNRVKNRIDDFFK
jgi:adenosine deaminase